MTLSNHTVTVARFWRKYLIALAESGVKASAVRWYVRHAEAYVEAARGRQIALIRRPSWNPGWKSAHSDERDRLPNFRKAARA